MINLKSSFKSKSDHLPPLVTEYRDISTNHNSISLRKPLNLEYNCRPSKRVTIQGSALNLEEWEVDHIQSPTNYKQHQVIAKAKEMVNDAAIFQANRNKVITKTFIQVKTMKSTTELRKFVEDIEKDNTKALKQIDNEKKKFNFNVFQSQSKTALKTNADEVHGKRKRKAQSISVIEMGKKSQEEVKAMNPYSLPGALENLINSEVEYQQMNKHKTEKSFNDELCKTINSIQALEKELGLLMRKIDALMLKLDEKKLQCSNANDIIEILNNERQLKCIVNDNNNSKGARRSSISTNKIKKCAFETNVRYLDVLTSAKKEKEMFQLDYENQLAFNNRTIASLKVRMKEIKADLKSLKRLHHTMVQESINYYLSLLKAGVDVRGVGLAWIIAKLSELGKKVTKEDCPQWISHNYYGYLIAFANKRIEIAKLGTLISIIKKKFIKKGSKEDINNTLASTIYSQGNDNSRGNNEKKSKSLEKLLSAYKANEKGRKNFTSMHEMNDITEEATPEEIHKKLLLIKSNVTEDNCKSSVISSGLPMNETFLLTQQRVFDHIIGETNNDKINIRSALLFLNELITKKEKEMMAFKKEEIAKFKAKFYNDKTKGTEECFNYDIVYFALFGNYSCV